jgi:hypothetical protein
MVCGKYLSSSSSFFSTAIGFTLSYYACASREKNRKQSEVNKEI